MTDKLKLLIITDNNGFLSGKLDYIRWFGKKRMVSGMSIDAKKIASLIRKQGVAVSIASFCDIDFDADYSDTYVIYASSDDRGLFYKSFIEDILLFLKMSGAKLIPEFEYFRAHENKAFSELIRKRFINDKLRVPTSRIYGSIEEMKDEKTFPVVVKMSSGSGSKGVAKADNNSELLRISSKMNRHRYYDFAIPRDRVLYHIKNMVRRKKGIPDGGYITKMNTNKFLVQDMILGLDCDYKVLYFFNKYYVLRRGNRENDFRASGSHKFSFPKRIHEIRPVLDFAKEATEEIGMPMQSLDIGMNSKGDCFLIEFQCVNFGPYTLQFSDGYFYRDKGQDSWCFKHEKSDYEMEYARSIAEYILNSNS